MATIIADSSQVGNVLATNVAISSITFVSPAGPGAPEPYSVDPVTGFPATGVFALFDGDVPHPVFLFDCYSNGGMIKGQAVTIMPALPPPVPVKSLILRSCPKGASFSITTTP
jgi:hypothetical protein